MWQSLALCQAFLTTWGLVLTAEWLIFIYKDIITGTCSEYRWSYIIEQLITDSDNISDIKKW